MSTSRNPQKKGELLALLLQKEGLRGTATRIEPREDVVDFHEPSFAQQRLWFLDQFDPNSATYNLAAGIRLTGHLNVSALEKALSEMTKRHEILRARFVVHDTHPRVVIDPQADLHLPVSDLRELPEAQREDTIKRLAQAEAESPFDLERGRLIRASLLQSRDDEHVLLITMHHIISDGWSLGVFVRELAALYEGFTTAQPATLPALPVQYLDFAHWQRQWLQGEVLERQLDYWRNQLANAPAPLEGLTDYARPPIQSFRGGRERLELSASLTKAVKDLSRAEGATVFMTLLASFKLLMHRLTGQDDLVVGSPIAGRNQAEVEGLIGFFVNTLALRTDLSGSPSFRELVARVREVTLGAYAHQDLPFELLIEKLQPERHPSHTPLFQVFFNMLNFPEQYDGIKLPGLKTESVLLPEFDAKFDLTLYAEDKGDKIQLDLVYNTSLFRRSRIGEILLQLNALLSQVVSDPHQQISRFSLVTTAAEALLPDPTQELISDWKGAVHTQFAEQAQRTPSHLALTDSRDTWNYEELNSRSNQLANYLNSTGVQPQEVVAIYGHRSASLVWAMLGALKAGAAFTILDPSYPPARLIECLRHVRPRYWLQVEAAGELPRALEEYVEGLSCLRLILPSRSDAEQHGTLADYASDDPKVPVRADDLAYVAFTSGSTGTPKAIAGTHKALPHFLQWHTRRFNLNQSDRFSMLSGLAHDPLLRDIFTPLSLGATLCISQQERMLDPVWLAQWLQHERISVAHITPALGQLLCVGQEKENEGAREESITLPSLRYFFFGGDLLTTRDVLNISAIAPAATCVNFYGTTETPQAMGYFVVPTQEDKGQSAEDDGPARQLEIIPLGRGIEDAQLLIVNQAGLLCGIGEPGEINVRTPYLAAGYFGDETLTHERFVTNPFTGRAEDRLYRTGDWGRYLPDGNVEFLGRRDAQVKVRGYRVELGDIEAALENHPSVRNVVVVTGKEESGDQHLVAYVMARQEQPGLVDELRLFLTDRVPEYMLPAYYVLLDEFPLTPNGKIDRRALPPPNLQADTEKGFYVAPRTPVEELLADIWSEILNVGQVGVYDNFFELGGHSLLAARLIARVRDTFAIDLPLRSFFNSPTVAGLAVVIAESRQDDGYEKSLWQLPAIVPAPEQRHLPFPLTDIQQAYWVGRGNAVQLGNVASQRYVELEATELDLERFNLAWQRLIERHDMLRAIVRPEGQQEILEHVPPYRIEVFDLRDRNAEEKESELKAIRERMSSQVMPTERWPLFEMAASRVDAQHIRLHCAFDYLIGDAWSFTLLFHELRQLYSQPDTTLPPLTLSFRDYVLGEVALKDSALYRRSKEYWHGRLPSMPPAPELPLAQNPDAVTQPRFVRRSLRIEPDAWQRLKSRANRAGLTPSGILLATFSELLAAWSRVPRFAVVVTLFNRLPMHPEVNNLVGDFTSTVLLAVDATGENFQARAHAVQEQLWHDLDHRYVSGVEVLREMIRIQGGISRTLMPVVFTSTLNLRDSTAVAAPDDGVISLGYSISQTPQVFLDHQVYERDGALILNWDAVEELFPQGLLDDMFSVYRRLLEGLTSEEDWNEVVSHLVPRAQLDQRAAINATAAEVSTEMLHTLFAAQVETRSEHMAVICSARRLTYEELYRRANQLARRLRELGARPNKLVAVVMHKGWEQIVGVLGILQSGAAYLPINAALPPERLRYLLEDGEVELVVTQSFVDEEIEWPEHITRLRVDGDELLYANDSPLPSIQRPDDLAYVIYTSGSTGNPKGVVIDHRGAVNTILDINRRFRVTADDRVLAISSLSFDLSVYDVFGMLAAGGTIVIPDAEASRDPAHWAELVQRENVTIWDSVPALMQMLVEHLSGRYAGELDTLRLVMMSGDWIPVTVPAQIKHLIDGVEVMSLGGATEASIWSILYPVEEVETAWKSIPYGKPMVNQSFHVLNEALRPCPVWVIGQLYIGGIGLAKGYWHNDEKTAASFIINPHTGERLYRTGDIGRYLPDGNIEFLGREDFQVKIQGYRIELGEIEAAFAEYANVRAVTVVALGELRGSKRLVAYVVPEPGATLTTDELKKFLRQKLPEYMVPTTIVFLDSLPLTSNGKVNRQALPPPEQVTSRAGQDDAPLTPMEEIVSGICAEILGVDHIGVNDNFFTLGVNSLQAIQFAVRVRETFQIELPLRQIFENPSVATIVPLIIQSQAMQLGDDEMAGLLEELEQLSMEEARQALTAESASSRLPL